ncbi:MAG: DNA translocase FtsK, partial [bacterium]|nr:DNA translocase FtsK [bacterium]
AELAEKRQNHPTRSQLREEEYLEYLREKKRREREADPEGEDTRYNVGTAQLNTSEPEVFHVKKWDKKKAAAGKSDEEHIRNSLGEMMSEEFDSDEARQANADGQTAQGGDQLTQDEENEKLFDEVMRRTRERIEKNHADDGATDEVSATETLDAVGVAMQRMNGAGETDSSKIAGEAGDFNAADLFVNPEDAELIDKLSKAYGAKLDVQRETVSKPSSPAPAPAKRAAPEYKFPPIEILAKDPGVSDNGVKEELQENAVKLVETLRSFNVKTKIENISRGPTITRYELLPEPGTRVRSIVNLVDDIALNLATTGVRIEAPIPGKSAVGIEVPNKKHATVHLRTLIENPQFTEAKSKLTVCLGENVGGEAVYFDIAKMPHMLIAGATGSGKSVCINSIITSILYKASPEDVKLILIDPKKVELNIYNGIPHLLVPVVSEPKKAAGSLSWAVSEMERRFGLIEAVGVRDIKNYNKAVENDPEYEYLPRIVIIIDELADLMMTAPDDVEESICRIAQKARAAGMHLVIGTQRPSVDVITGLIKANIPSRIAFRTSSQIDSRTIIDIG